MKFLFLVLTFLAFLLLVQGGFWKEIKKAGKKVEKTVSKAAKQTERAVSKAAKQTEKVVSKAAKQTDKAATKAVKQAVGLAADIVGHKKTVESVDQILDKPMELSVPKVSHMSHHFVAKNPADFIHQLEKHGVAPTKSELLKQDVFDCFATKSKEVLVWLPSNTAALIQVLFLRTVERADRSVDVSAVLLTATVNVKAERDILKRKVKTQWFNNQETKSTETSARGLSLGEVASLYDVLLNSILTYPKLSEVVDRKKLPTVQAHEQVIMA
eukprot:gene7970-9502_t